MKHELWQGFQKDNRQVFWWFARHSHPQCRVQIYADTQEMDWQKPPNWRQFWYQTVYIDALKQWYCYRQDLDFQSEILLDNGKIDEISGGELALIQALPTDSEQPFLPINHRTTLPIQKLAFMTDESYETIHPYEAYTPYYCEKCQTFHTFGEGGYYEGYIDNPTDWQNPLIVDYYQLDEKTITTYWAAWITDLVFHDITVKPI